MFRNNSEFDLSFEIHHLLQEEPFYAAISRNMNKVADYSLPTAGVRFNKDKFNFELRYNPKFLCQLEKEHIKFVLCHEFNHCIFGHVTDRLPIDSSVFSAGSRIKKEDRELLQRWNIATDFAINSMPFMKKMATNISWVDVFPTPDGRYLKQGIIMPGRDASLFSPIDSQMTADELARRAKFINMCSSLPEGMSAEWYMKNMPEDIANQGGEGHDDHGEWMIIDSDGSPLSEDEKEVMRKIASQKMKDILKKEFNNANLAETEGIKGWGSVSSAMRREILEKISTKLNPRNVLRYFIKTSVASSERNSITKVNKKWGYIHPGRRYNETANIAISIDESGSVDDKMMQKFFGWLNDFAKYATFTVIPFDSHVFEDKIYVWEQGSHKKFHRQLCGGTDFQAPTDYVNKNKFDGHIILTDMYAPKPGKSKCKRMWITTRSCLSTAYFETNEKVLVID